MIRYLAFLFIILASVGFFNYHAVLTPVMEKMVFYISVLSGLFVAMVYGFSTLRINYPRRAFIGLLTFMMLSSLVCSEFHMQSMPVTLRAALPILLAYSTFYIFLRLRIPPEKVIKTYIVLCAMSTIVYFCNMFTMPNNIFGQPILDEDMSRGIVRIFAVFIEIFPLIVFYGINRYQESKQKKWLLLVGWAAVMIFLSVTRQLIAYTAILGLWFFFRKISVIQKLTTVVLVIVVVVEVLPQIPVYKTMIELSEDQKDENEKDENVRIKAWRYYTYENQPSVATVLLGNGVPSMGLSTWGVQFDSDTEVTGCYAADVGWAGFFYYFGLIDTICLLIILLAAIIKKKQSENQYLNYWLVMVVLLSFTSGPILYYYQIVSICVVLYLVFGCQSKSRATIKESNDETFSSDNTRRLQCRRYPQLH